MEAKIDELETNSKIKNNRDLYTGINDFKKGYQSTTNVVKDEKGYLITDSHSITGIPRGGGQTPPKFQSFDKAKPKSLFRGKYIRNNLIRIHVSLICKMSGTPD
jgi:hypothetical protein